MRIAIKRICAVILGLMMVLSISIAVSGPTHVAYADEGSQEMYRMYNPNSGEHFYTANSYERDNLKSLGWHYEGVGWVAPVKSSVPVYRLYNSNAGDHHYTMNSYERDMLVSKGWRYEGVGWYSADTTNEFPLYRQYNPNAKAGAHNYTLNSNERDALVRAGWHDEGLAWYALGLGDYNLKKIQKVIHNYDAVLTFHKEDAERLGYFYCAVMPYRLPEINQGSLSESDVFFIGANKGRYKHLLLIYDKLSNAGLKCDFFICDVAKKEQIKKDGIVYNKRITYDEVLKHIKASKCVLEVLQNGNNYISIRTSEALQLNKKLLTTNREIMNTPLYNEDLVQVFSGDDINIDFIIKDVAADIYDNFKLNTSYSEMKKFLEMIFK